jgi:hypothetical protein
MQPEEAVSMKLQDYLILIAAFISFTLSVLLWFSGQKDEGLFVGIWVPSILAFGAYFRAAYRGSNHV